MKRKELVERVGEEIVKGLDVETPDFSGVEENGEIEFTSFAYQNDDILIAFYYQNEDDVKNVENLDELTWEINHYDIA